MGDIKTDLILHIKRGKKYFSFKCPYCKKQMRRQYIGATFVCDKTGGQMFEVKEIKTRKKKK